MRKGEQILQELLATGIAHEERGQYFGVASDGQEVMIGDCRDSTIAYLETHPSPNDW